MSKTPVTPSAVVELLDDLETHLLHRHEHHLRDAFSRADLVTELVPGARDLAEVLFEAGDAEDILAAAEEVLGDIDGAEAPGFVRERIDKLKRLIDMLSDVEWRLQHNDAKRVLNALAYFAEPEDLIPDHIPGIGFLDDAIMIELVVRELRHEIEAYEDFCRYRQDVRDASGARTSVSRQE